MGNVATTIEQQIEKLSKRGLIFENENEIEKAKEILLDIGYYRLGFYWYYFQDKKTHKFNKNINLKDIVKLYYFDFDLKMLLLRYIYRIEVHFRTQLIYLASNNYPENNAWYIDPKIVNSGIFKEFNNIYYILKTKNNTLIKHHSKHSGNYAPAWKVLSDTTITSATASVSYDLGDYSSYEQFRILLNGVVPDTDARHMRILLGVNGSGYAETNFYGNSRVHMVDNGSVHRIRVNQQNWHNNAVGSAANEGGVTMNLYLANYNNTSYYKQIHGTFAIVSDNGTCMPGVIAQSAGATTIDSIQFKFNTGSIESGRFTLLGQEA